MVLSPKNETTKLNRKVHEILRQIFHLNPNRRITIVKAFGYIKYYRFL